MATKQELIKWMTETRESLPFESKVKLIKDFWDNKVVLEQFFDKHGKSSLEEINELITKKDTKIFQLSKLIKGNEKIFQKQYTNIYELQEQLKKEVNEKGISKEKAEHLTKDIERLDEEKKKLDERIKELEEERKKSESERDKEIADLKQKIKELTEVKMARQESEEKLKKQSEEFLQVQNIHGLVYNILGEYSKENGLLLRSQEIIKKIKEYESSKELSEFLKVVSAILVRGIREYSLSVDGTHYIINLIDEWKEGGRGKEETRIIHNKVYEQVEENVKKTKTLKRIFDLLKDDLTALNESKLKEKGDLCCRNNEFLFPEMFSNLQKLIWEHTKEKFWWDKWINDKEVSIQEFSTKVQSAEIKSFLEERKKINFDFEPSFYWHCGSDLFMFYRNITDYLKHFKHSREEEVRKNKLFVKAVYEYYKNK